MHFILREMRNALIVEYCGVGWMGYFLAEPRKVVPRTINNCHG